ncbi:TrbG/VirB9 family P-type conjugative transfer protein [Paraburkholderia sp. CNPSo 3274]|uniref:TrbG/VirB9 family P-type conjugative transfer protein n=1 Tax=unclassified Paraburkholderia TaxID=2615204 RepID=UPI0020B867D9|nr:MULTISPECIES: TrbG/VirB9 family P-type conjugative transfer protein [unclassified Paraburkholderia]MCP3712593.1 TrbG/VirB9 family P-type conjugative transfer protein [Paraburkholderia sp. CNPSo 3274]MCP3718521.1 TrbG/VirB9 family P-type conjugative transfer protein [Paraburkholderia sp. CNPSo 3281]
MTRRLLTLATLCAIGAAQIASAANTDPFDFDYEIAGGIAERPALVFNDGTKTYIQPRAGQTISVAGSHREGPYMVVDGTPATIQLSVAGHAAVATWNRANAFIGGHGMVPGAGDDQPATFAGFSGRLALIGERGALEPVRSLNGTMAVASIVKALVPQGWSGSAQKDVDLTAANRFETQPGENWMHALDRLMTQTGLYADVDFDSRHVRLRRDVEKSGALAYAGATVTHADPVSAASDAVAAVPAAESLLAKYFGANAIRDGDDTHTQIRFAAKPKDLKFTRADGSSLHPKWDADTSVMTIDRVDRFVVADPTNRVEVARSAGTVYDFPAGNGAHLEAVFDEGGQTYFKFAPTVINVTVADVHHLGSGEQKGRFYRFNGTSEQFIVTADGNTVSVLRRHDVKYFERAGAA